MHAPAISVEQLVVHRDGTVAVDGISFAVELGEVVVLLGPNGAGKTSTAETIEGYLRPYSGRVRVLGSDPVADHAVVVRRLGVMLQGGGVYAGLRVEEALSLFAAFYDDAADVDELIGRMGLSGLSRRSWRQLSGGEQQRVSLALALVGRPEVVVLDEPTSGVDLDGRRRIREVVRDLADEGTAVLLTTHELAEAERVADRAVIVDHGRVVGAGRLDELRTGGQEIRFGAPADLDVTALGAALGYTVDRAGPGEYVVRVEPTPGHVAALTAWLADHDLPLADLRAGRHALEDVVARLTAASDADGAA